MEESSLVAFPTEIWSIVSSLLSLEDLGRLKTTGDSMLWAKLCDPRSVKGIVVDSKVSSDWSLPAFLKDFTGLLSLTIRPKYTIDGLKCRSTIADIPSTVNDLHITRIDAVSFLEPLTTQLEHAPKLTSLAMCAWWTPSSGLASLTSLANLEKLDVTSWNTSIALPSSIHQLILRSSFDFNATLGQYPPNLAELSLWRPRKFSEFVAHLPPTLESLTIWNGSERFTAAEIRMLPRNLVKLSDEGMIATTFSKSDWPSGLEYLHLDEVPPNLWSELPRTLKFFRLRQIRSKNVEPSYLLPIEKLPRSLCELHLGASDGNVLVIDLHEWHFPELQQLSLPESHVTINTIRKMPLTLTALEAGTLTSSSIPFLPRTLQKLIIQATELDSVAIAGLPRNLTNLAIHQTNRSVNFDLEKNRWATVYRASLLGSIRITEDLWKGNNVWPRYLTRLVINCFDNLNNDFMSALPRHLTHLDLHPTTRLNEKGLEDLPSSLVYLSLSEACSVTSACFGHLPRQLRTLKLANSENIFDSNIAELPQHLTILALNSAIHLSNSCVKHLPPKLEYLMLDKNWLIDVEASAHFPASMFTNPFFCTFNNANFKIFNGKFYEHRRP